MPRSFVVGPPATGVMQFLELIGSTDVGLTRSKDFENTTKNFAKGNTLPFVFMAFDGASSSLLLRKEGGLLLTIR